VRNKDTKTADNFLVNFENLPIEIIDTISDTMMREVAVFKTNYSMSLADSFALATASTYDASVVTSDHHEFNAVEKNTELSFCWIR
jgi:predicted nucleic acid-binding protein